MNNTLMCYCDKCGLKIANYQPRFDHQELTLCSDCALDLYRKINPQKAGKEKDRFTLSFDTMPKSTAQQKRYNGRTHTYFKDARLLATEQSFYLALRPYAPKTPSDKPIELHIWFYFDIKEKKKWGKPKTSKPDVDNFSKAFIDQMTKSGFWNDDSQITDLHIEKYYADKASIVVTWKEIENE